jgi:hypothetical protein
MYGCCVLWWLCSTLRGVRVSSSSAVIPSSCLSMESPRFYPQLCLRFAFWFETFCPLMVLWCVQLPWRTIRDNQPAI